MRINSSLLRAPATVQTLFSTLLTDFQLLFIRFTAHHFLLLFIHLYCLALFYFHVYCSRGNPARRSVPVRASIVVTKRFSSGAPGLYIALAVRICCR
jgi:hypothetical protein